MVEELEDTLDVQDVEVLRELSESMYEGLATTRETHAKLREKTRNRGYQPSSSASSHTAFGSRRSSLSGSGRGKKKTRTKGGSVQQKLVIRCFDCNRFGHWSGDPIEHSRVSVLSSARTCARPWCDSVCTLSRVGTEETVTLKARCAAPSTLLRDRLSSARLQPSGAFAGGSRGSPLLPCE